MSTRVLTCVLALLCSAVPLLALSICPPKCKCEETHVRCADTSHHHIPQNLPLGTTLLDLRFNRIKEVPKNSLKDLKYLQTLLLNNNQITKLENGSFNGLRELKYLYLYKNKIRDIESHAFHDLQKLEHLYLHFNKLETIEPEVFSTTRNIKRLFMHNNALQKIPYGSFKNMGSLLRLRLDRNALICDCEMMWLAHMLKEKKSTTQAAATCQYPRPLQGKALTAVRDEDFHCKKPRITEEPHDVEVSFGGTAYFRCQADGDPMPSIVWLHNNIKVDPDSTRHSILTDGTLRLKNAQQTDMGVYECVAVSATGEIKSRSAKAHMLYHTHLNSPRIVKRPINQDILKGDTLTLPCGSYGNPSPNIVWVKDDVILTSSGRFWISDNGTLYIKNVDIEDAGQYHCSASNYLGRDTVEVRVRIQAPPMLLSTPDNIEVLPDSSAEFSCTSEGMPIPLITWFRNEIPIIPDGRIVISAGGSHIVIRRVQDSDRGFYKCLAQNRAGSAEAVASLTVTHLIPPTFTTTPSDKTYVSGDTVMFKCEADGFPTPVVTWLKENNPIPNDPRIGTAHGGQLVLEAITSTDAGKYQCSASNSKGSISTSFSLHVREAASAVDNNYIIQSVEEAKKDVNKAVEETIASLFNQSENRIYSSRELSKIFRFPDAKSREIAVGEEVYERALQIVQRHVESGMTFNLSEFSHRDVLSSDQLQLLAELSGCLSHRRSIQCEDMCFHLKYRSIDGTCNNLKEPMWGASLTAFKRLLSPTYENGFNTPIGWSRNSHRRNYIRPSARLVSSRLFGSGDVSGDTDISHMTMQWGQFLDHDLDLALPSVSKEAFHDGVDCETSCAYSPPCFPIDVPSNDPRIRESQCMFFVRSSAVCGSGSTSVFLNDVLPREQLNQLTSFIDGSQIYGSTEDIAILLRNTDTKAGLLRVGISNPKPLLPFNIGLPIDCKRGNHSSPVNCFLAGDIRANEQLGLLAMHTIWMREHNRIAKVLKQLNPHWHGETVFYEARKIVGAQLQHITYEHWLPKVLGPRGMEMMGPYKGYNPNIDPSVSNAFATAAFRFGHTLINPILYRLNSTFQPIQQGHIPLHKAFFAPHILIQEGGVDPLMRGLFHYPAKLKTSAEFVNSELTQKLFWQVHGVALDLAAMNIQRGRDHGIPGYNDWRVHCGLRRAESFYDLKDEIQSREVREKLQQLYKHPDHIDLWVGGILEDTVDGAKMGPTFLCIISDQFRRLRDGDRFFYENPGVFKPEQLTQIKQTSMGRVLCDSGDQIDEVTQNVFQIPGGQNPLVGCANIPQTDLNFWTECCEGCSSGGLSQSISDLNRRKREAGFSYPEDKPLRPLNQTPGNDSNSVHYYLEDPMADSASLWEDVNEERLEGIESLLEKMGKTIRVLQKKIRRLETKHRNKLRRHQSCVDVNGQVHKHGEQWKTDLCTQCACAAGKTTCAVTTCPVLTCATARHLKDECCPVC